LAGTITGLQFQKHAADRVNVFLDGRFAFGLPALEAARLRVGQFLSDDEIAQLEEQDTQQKAYDRAVRFLSYRPRSVAEVRRYLARPEHGYSAEVVEATLARLAEQGYLNDEEFARFWVDNRQRFRPKGSQALRQELRQRGLDGESIEGALAGLDLEESAYEAARPRALRLAALVQSDPQTFRRKLADFLLRRGFGYEVTEGIVKRLLREIASDDADLPEEA
jgi:regulatory protein